MKHSQEEKPLILPVYTEAEEMFWLFYAITKPTQIQQTGPLTKITSWTLVLLTEGCYKSPAFRTSGFTGEKHYSYNAWSHVFHTD
jgi:hypothetical protein